MSAPRTTPAARVEWLLAHERAWQGWPGGWRRETAWRLAEMMRAEGLYSPRTSLLDIVSGQERLINEARRRRRERRRP